MAPLSQTALFFARKKASFAVKLLPMKEKNYLVLAYYNLVELPDPQAEIAAHKAFFKERDVTGRIYISEQGINGQMSGSRHDASAYIDWMEAHPLFKETSFKLHAHHENVFPRMTVKYRKQLVALDRQVDFKNTGEHLPAAKWKEMLETEKNRILIDVRNSYEWNIGHFEGAELPPFENFRDFYDYAQKLKEEVNPAETPVMMYCTGGIRCELFSSLLKEQGFEKVYQLDGGVIKYGLDQGNDHWKGKLFVFDDRLAIPISDTSESEVISCCHHCGEANDTYLNCANMDCNRLFLCCPACAKTFVGCCQESCTKAERLRRYHAETGHKPFRRKHLVSHSCACELTPEASPASH
jgi:UPF0176 protein